MKNKKKIQLLFQRLKPILERKLMNPGVLEPFRDRMFMYDGMDSYEMFGTSDVAQLCVALNDEEAEGLLPEEYLTMEPSPFHNVWYVYPNWNITVPWDGWQVNLMISLKTDFRQNYMLCVGLVCHGFKYGASHGQVVVRGSFGEVEQAIRSGKFSSMACVAFYTCLESVSAQIRELEQRIMESRRFAEMDITDYDSVMRFVESVKNRKLLKGKGRGLQLFEYDRVVALVNRKDESVKLLVDRNGKARFCSIGDFPDALLKRIRMEKTDWNLDVHELSVGSFNISGLSSVTWVISPYYYCPMDEDGFGEEEEYEVAVTCHIDTSGHLADTPLRKPYTGPRR